MTLSDKIMLDAINTDMLYMGRFINSLKDAEGDTGVGATFSMFPYFSLFIYESRAQLKIINPSAYNAIVFSSNASDLSARSRHSLKLFEDTKRGIEGQLTYFDSINRVHRKYYIGSVRLPFADRWKTDLSMVYYDYKLVSTSHSTTFGLGIELKDLFQKDMGQILFDISVEYGQYLSAWGVTEAKAESFATEMSAAKYAPKDKRSSDLYSHSFNGSATPSFNALLTCFQALTNSCDKLISLDTSFESSQTNFKIKYLTVYQVLRSLELFQSQKRGELTVESMNYINKLLGHPVARLILDPTKKSFRNTLMHYNIDTRIDILSLSLSKPLYGLSETVYGIDFNDLRDQVNELVEHSASILNQWSGQL